MRAEAKATVLCFVGALLWFLPWLAPGKALLGSHVALFPPWSESASPELLSRVKAAVHPLYHDKLIQHDPEVRFSIQGEGQGEGRDARGGQLLPAWNPDVLGGVPHLATGLSSALYPLMWISRLVPPPHCYAVIALLQTALAGWFAFLMARSFGLAPLASGCAALLFAGSGWMSVHQEYFQLTAAATWLPLSIYGAKRLLDPERRRGGALSLGAAIACAFLSGFPQIAVYSLLAPALLAMGTIVARLSRRTEPPRALGRHALAFGLPVALGLAIASPQILSTLELVPLSTRRPLTAVELEQQSLPPLALAGAIAPDLVARSLTQAEIEQELDRAEEEQRAPRLKTIFELALSTHRDARDNRFEVTFALGPAALLLALFGLLGGRVAGRSFFGALLGIGLLLALEGPVLRMSALVPGLNVGDPKRALLLVELALVGLAALGVQRVVDEPAGRRRAQLLLGAGVLLLLGGAAWCTFADAGALGDWATPRIARNLGLDRALVANALRGEWLAESRERLRRECLVAATMTAFALFALMALGREPPMAPGGCLMLALALPLALVWKGTTSPIPVDGLDAKPPLLRWFLDHPPKGRLLRIGAHDLEKIPWPPKLPMELGVRDAQGYVAAYVARWRDLFEAIEPRSTETTTVWPLSKPELLERPLFDLLDIEYVIALLPTTDSPPKIEGFDLVPLEPSPAGATEKIILWRNRGALGRAVVVRRVHVSAREDEVVTRVTGAGFVPYEEAWVAASADDAGAGGGAVAELERAGWKPAAAGHGAQRTLEVADADGGAPDVIDAEVAGADLLRLRVQSGGGLLVQGDCWYPGWTVKVDGARATLLRVDHALRGVVVPPGDHVVEFRYLPGRLTLGLFLAPVALVGLLIVSFLFHRRAASP